MAIEETASGTDLLGQLNEEVQTLPQNRLGAVIALTDGITLPGRLDLPEGVPFHGLLTGSEEETDLSVKISSHPLFVPVGEFAEVEVVVEGFGALVNEPVALEIRQDGETLISRTLQPNTPATLALPVAKSGQNTFIVSIDQKDAELTHYNNMATFEIEGTRDTLKVLLVSGAPHAGQRAWREILKSDPSVDLVHFTILRPPFKQDRTPVNELALIAFPTYELFVKNLEEFDLIIFDRYQRIGVLPSFYFENIADYVRNGGALLVMSGPEYAGFETIFDSALADVLPAAPTGEVEEIPYHPRLSALGKRHPVTKLLPGAYAEPPTWGRWYRTINASVSNGKVLMENAEEEPVLVLSDMEEGRVAQMLSDHAWLWARGVEEGGPYVPLLRRLVHWLMKEPQLESEQLSFEVRNGVNFIVRQTEAETVPPLTITGGQTPQTYDMSLDAPGQWRTSLEALEPGIYRAAQGDLGLDFVRQPTNPAEYASLQTRKDMIETIDAPGGAIALSALGENPQVLRVTSGGRYQGRTWIGVEDRRATELVRSVSVPLFTGLLGLGLFALAFAALWGVEGRRK